MARDFLLLSRKNRTGRRISMFVDIPKIKIKAGSGGNGAVSFRREKYVAAGGPDGGDGGKGGNIVFQVDDNLSTLADFRYKRKYTAPNGENGRGGRCFGKGGEDCVIRVPRGTRMTQSSPPLPKHRPPRPFSPLGAVYFRL